jgi:DNA-binding CsgD family transcriptional regulator
METNEKIKLLLLSKNYQEIADLVGISIPTLYRKMQLNNWKKSEIFLIKNL